MSALCQKQTLKYPPPDILFTPKADTRRCDRHVALCQKRRPSMNGRAFIMLPGGAPAKGAEYGR
jgi:hypothetical protein